MKKYLFIIAALLIGISAFAQPRSEQEAMQIAKGFFAKSAKKKAPQLSVVSQEKVSRQIRKKVPSAQKAPAQHSSCYIINDEANNRFIIISSDERLNLVLGYSDNGCFDLSQMPDGLIEVLNGYDRQYEFLLEHNNGSSGTGEVRNNVKAISPLIKSKWGQGDPYNAMCPKDKTSSEDEICATGCVATAMAQIMNYFRYPAKASGSWSYFTESQNTYQKMDFGEVTFRWDNMTDEYDEGSLASEREAVAQLMHACGVSVSMDYGPSSGAYSPNIPYALYHYFSYNPNILYREREYYSVTEWDSLIVADLQAGHPILYSGSGSGGHQFILDGVDAEGLYHFNFGWNGLGDGFFELDAVKPLFGILGNYSYYQAMVCQIAPQKYGTEEDVFYSDRFDASRTSIPVGQTVRFWLNPICYSAKSTYQQGKISTFNGKVGVGIYDENFQFIKSLDEVDFSNTGVGEGQRLYKYITLDDAIFKDGKTFYICGYAKDNRSAAPTLIRTPEGETKCYKATVDRGTIALIPKYDFMPEEPEPINIKEGDYTATAYTADKKEISWVVSIWKDINVPGQYGFGNIDPQLVERGITNEKGLNRVYGSVNAAGLIEIKSGQPIADNIKLNNISAGGPIKATYNQEKESITFSSIWGSVEITSASDGNASIKELSRYENATLIYGVSEPDPVKTPIISVSDGYLMISGCDEGAIIYYTLNNESPLTSQSKKEYNGRNPEQLKAACVIRAVAVLDGRHSEEASYSYVPPLPDYVTVSTEAAGQLANLLSSEQKMQIKRLRVQGPINGTDINYLHSMHNDGQLIGLDLTNATIVAGGDSYWTSDFLGDYFTKDNVVGDYLFYQWKKLEEVLLPASITEIGDMALSYCKALSEIVIPKNVKKIGMMAFESCSNLASVDLPDGLQELELMSFAYCTSLRSFSIPKGVKEIESSAFSGCKLLSEFFVDEDNPWFAAYDGVLYTKNMRKLVRCPMGLYSEAFQIPDGVEEIGDDAFQYCKNIKRFYLPESVRKIGSSAFSNCLMSNIKIPEKVYQIDMMAFENCDSLESFIIPENLEEIPLMMIAYCKRLSFVQIPAGIKTIDLSAFSSCTSLRTIQSEIKNIDLVDFPLSYDDTYSQFTKLPDDCTWLVPFGPDGDEYYYVNLYKAQPWWVKTWNPIPDGVHDLKTSVNLEGGAWYTIQGTRLNGKPQQQGIYLHGGKKVMIK